MLRKLRMFSRGLPKHRDDDQSRATDKFPRIPLKSIISRDCELAGLIQMLILAARSNVPPHRNHARRHQ